MSRITVVDRLADLNESAPTFGHSIKSMKERVSKRHAGLFSTESSLTEVQRNYLFEQFKAHVKDRLATLANIQAEFLYKLLMKGSPDANCFLNILAGWNSSANDAHKPLLDTCIRDFKTVYPEIYDEINRQEPIYKPK
ncbi:MAG: hypothetical protein A3E85_01110 [Gammaproteobacteria bacterium RIFCSPHIGHO2_12_FULL_45_12]|nr:MAG: hypothetical protein A3E85_01110 [Gammaproteobacteria bacterium RIFCSPHIGHO2_12_FULL_45_12]